MELKNVIKKPIITEKTTAAAGLNRYAFEVSLLANKSEIKKAIEKFFGVHVKKLWTTRIPGRRKKAFVQLNEGEKIDLFKTGE